jgi:hypothetical protein
LREAYKCTEQREVNVKKPQNKKGQSRPEPSCRAKGEDDEEGGEDGGEEDKDHTLPRKVGIRLPIEAISYSRRMKSSVTVL